MDQELCWCGSGKAYADCHKMNDAKIALLQAQGCEVPDRDMIQKPRSRLPVSVQPAKSIQAYWTRLPSILRPV